MSRNHPDRPDDLLLQSAIDVLIRSGNTFEVKDWRTIMASRKKAPAPEKSPFSDPFAMFKGSGDNSDQIDTNEPTSGIDSTAPGVVQSSSSPFGAVVNNLSKDPTMTEKTRQEIAEETAKAKIAAKAERLRIATEKKAAAEQKRADALAAKEAKAAAAAQAKADKEAAKKAAAEQKATNPATAEGMSSALRDKVSLGIYVKGKNGQLRTNDELALALEVVPVINMVPLLLETLGMNENPYPHLNYGQQSMNLRNRLRGAIRKEAKIENTDVVISLARLIELRDAKYLSAEKPSTEAATTEQETAEAAA